METLLKPGDMIRIREDISEQYRYKMIFDNDNKNSWIRSVMAAPGTLVTIQGIADCGQYITDYSCDEDFKIEGFWSYTDEMFDPDMLSILLEERYDL